jgi:hypothetical protein
MNKPLAEFTFENLDFLIIDETKGNIHITIDRVCRAFPTGVIVGYEAILSIRHDTVNAVGYHWEICSSGSVIQTGKTNADGGSGDLALPLPYGSPTSYEIKVFGPEMAGVAL